MDCVWVLLRLPHWITSTRLWQREDDLLSWKPQLMHKNQDTSKEICRMFVSSGLRMRWKTRNEWKRRSSKYILQRLKLQLGHLSFYELVPYAPKYQRAISYDNYWHRLWTDRSGCTCIGKLRQQKDKHKIREREQKNGTQIEDREMKGKRQVRSGMNKYYEYTLA